VRTRRRVSRCVLNLGSPSPRPLPPRRPPRAQAKCEAILRSEPDNSNAEELHLACVHSQDERKRKEDIAVGGGVALAGIGLAVGLLGMVLGGKR